MLEVSTLSLRYGQHPALCDISISIERGETVAVIGGDGAGKSSLLEAIAGLVPVNARTRIALDGRIITGWPPHRIIAAGIALVPEGGGVFGALTVEENLLLGTHPARACGGQAKQKALVYALFPKLAEHRREAVNDLSAGAQRTVAVGRALMSGPDFLMLDQPSLGLKPVAVTALFSALDHLRKSGMAILIAEQNTRVSLAVADRGYLMESGRIVGANTADALMHEDAAQPSL
ncbi:ABC transporter ATP-binding protein [Nitratireductor soli]|uniref:ABC transporter ATP-binding protein n=1 Tax=Nitratireductor soli TaxID=1670619 RepID=UPI00065E88AC|nr:ABC transporter ATP-binding protein [Nitratireductor soli]